MKIVLIEQDELTASPLLDFSHARHQANLEELKARLTGKSAALLCYDDVCRQLKIKGTTECGLSEIPLDAIVGSVGRWNDFTRSFWPRQDSDQQRWAMIKIAMTSPGGLPPIEVYQIGQVYFVLDGNHRVSVARELGASHIEAYVTKVDTRVSLSPDVQPDELSLKAEYADFLELTHLDILRPEADLSVTISGQYQLLEAQIEAYGQRLEQNQSLGPEEVIGRWYDEVYYPVVQIIRRQNLGPDFPDQTETDLYLWLSKHQIALAQKLGYEVEAGAVAADLVAQFSPTLPHVLARTKEKLLDAVTPDPLEAGPMPGQWRRERLATHQSDNLFADILVPVSGQETDWQALAQALQVAHLERGRLHGLYVVSIEAQRDGQAAQTIQAEFERRCQVAGFPGELTVEAGGVARRICERAWWADLVVVGLSHPPASQPLTRLSSKFSTLIRRCSRPVLVVPGDPSPIKRALLAYDGSPQADEALFMTANLCQPDHWNIPLIVITVTEGEQLTLARLARAKKHLAEHQVQATFVIEHGPVAEAILNTAAAHQSDLIIMGSYGFSPMLEIALGSTVDQVLRSSRRPVLVCR